MSVLSTSEAPAAIGPYSQGHTIGELIITSGQLPIDPDTNRMAEDIAGQTRQSLMNILAVVRAGGGDASSVLKTTCFLADMADFAAFNEAYAEFFSNHHPARICVAVRELPLGAKVEIEAIAYRAKSGPAS